MSIVFDFNLLEKKCNVDMCIYYTMGKVPCKILNTVVLKTMKLFSWRICICLLIADDLLLLI